ncbi:hypothetical protein [Streptomyces hilarionis]|uniref:hypothetical protein n=1 Tax=Streptomyces hilarionis TaxID=2839954 RepID=UPI00211A0212|nr:hypothetical protein [Streptomyces hilarionis]MCQ9132040.1 hypothetical protein [Streptomyces hilarionis]
MPRGRHRHSPPLHRLLPPSAIAGVSLVCALGPWVFTQATALRVLAAAAAATAVVGAVVMRHWDVQAGKQVADLTRARAGDEWRFEERVAELESDLEESRELRVKLEQRLRSKRAELAGLRNEHAALLRRYATAETERASALEGRRLLEIEAAPTPALPAARGPQDAEPTGRTETSEAAAVSEASGSGASAESAEASRPAESAESSKPSALVDSAGSGESGESGESGQESARTSAVFSPAGSQLFLRAQAALARLDADGVEPSHEEPGDRPEDGLAEGGADQGTARTSSTEAAQEDEAQGKPEAVDEHTRVAAPSPVAQDDADTDAENVEAEADESHGGEASQGARPSDEDPAADEASSTDVTSTQPAAKAVLPEDGAAPDEAGRAARPLESAAAPAADGAPATRPEPAPDVDPDRDPDPDPDPGPGPGRGLAHAVETPAAAEAGAVVRRPAAPVQRPSGHFAVPTAVAVVPAAEPVRRPTAEGGFDFFGTKSDAEPDALEAVQNEDLADVVGQEALALHKAESEAEFKPADEAARGVGQVIDLTAHDETEHIDLKSLRSAVS